MLVVLAALTACAAPAPLPPPGAEDGTLFLWRGGEEPVRIEARRVRQAEESLQQLALEGVEVVLPLRDGRLWLRAEQGSYRAQDEEALRLAPPVLIDGWLGRRPAIGRAEGAAVSAGERQLRLRGLELLIAGERLRFDEAVVPESWRERSLGGSGASGESASALAAAALGAIAAAGE
jgi:hypothetical protein